MAKTEKTTFADAVESVRPETPEPEKPASPWAGNGGARSGAGRKRSHHGPSERKTAPVAGKGREPAPPPEPMKPEEAAALLKQLDGMVVMVLRTRPLEPEELETAGKQLAPILPEVLAKLTPGAVAAFGLAMLYVPRLAEVWATRRAEAQRRKAGAVAGGTATDFRPVVEAPAPAPAPAPVEEPVTDREALAMGVVATRPDPVRRPVS